MLRGARLGLSGGPIARNRFFHKFKLVDPIKAYFIARRQSTVVFGARLKRSILMFSVSLAQINGVGATTTLAGTPFQGRIQEPKFLLHTVAPKPIKTTQSDKRCRIGTASAEFQVVHLLRAIAKASKCKLFVPILVAVANK